MSEATRRLDIINAQAFPRSTSVGFADHRASIHATRRRVAASPLIAYAFEVAEAGSFPGSSYDLIAIFEALHDLGDAVRRKHGPPAASPTGVRSHGRSEGSQKGATMARGVPKQVVDWLGAVPLFSACAKAELRTIASFGTELNISSGKVLTEQGKPGREFFLVISGSAGCEIDGKRVATFGPGDFFGEMALIDRGPRTATVTAETQMELLVLDSREFSELLDTSPSISKKLLLAFAARRREDDAFTH